MLQTDISIKNMILPINGKNQLFYENQWEKQIEMTTTLEGGIFESVHLLYQWHRTPHEFFLI